MIDSADFQHCLLGITVVKMFHSKYLKHAKPVETELPIDAPIEIRSTPLSELALVVPPPTRSPRQRRWAWLLIPLLLIGGVGWSFRWWQTSQAQTARQTGATGGAAGLPGKPLATSVNITTVGTNTVQDSTVFVGILESPRFVTVKPLPKSDRLKSNCNMPKFSQSSGIVDRVF
jgi:hypothetical protein